ncbi:hypothetical protein A3F66_06360 [candidate division TM6 bacterium RIFCSPHIGHO2_12_FULL_32_22]|nr:MAG: hypothetical protein A3F66_06360 [candidate division TM6 bacterium RIFCSPHIGHO2_12_FULL_32_22]
MFIKRNLSKNILRLSQAFPVVAILGPRQSGKTTLVKELFKNYKYLSLEDLSLRADAKQDPKGFLNLHKNNYGIIIDEFQHVPELLSYIHLAVDENRRPGYFILTGSQNFLMNRAISQTLAGRIAITTLLPLSFGELKESELLPDNIEDLVFKGEYPGLYTNSKLMPYDMYLNYTKTYVERDVRDLQNVQNLSLFIKFMKLCAARIGQVINYSSLANDADINLVTAKSWLSILETSYIIFTLQPYSAHFTRRLIKTPKLFFYDTGLASYLLGIESVDDLKISTYRGNLIESLIISQITKLYYNDAKNPNIYFLRDKTGHEIDCLIEKSNRLIPIEIKSRMTPSQSAFDEINFWKDVEQIGGKKIENGFIVYSGNETEKRTYGTFLSWKDLTDFKSIGL